ncbi:hypothetical protein H4R24_002736 [Coemansia sp. RSA 988]|nr:hypothetical protein H4R24_002736 [Coemansia sp. RSA 988]
MLSLAAFSPMRKGVLSRTAALGRGCSGRATYQTHAHQGRHIYSKSNWGAQLLAYLRNGLDLLTNAATRRLPHASAAQRLRMAMLRGPAKWLGGLGLRTPMAVRNAAPRVNSGYFRLLMQQLAGQKMGMRGSVFGSGGRWSPFTNMFVQSFRSFSMQGSSLSGKAVMAQINRQAAIGLLTQQRRDFAIALPLARYTQTERHSAKRSRSRHTLERIATESSTICRTPALADTTPLARRVRQDMPTNPTAHEAAAFADHCVTITVPQVYAGSVSTNNGFVCESAFSADAAQLLAKDICHAQNRHTTLVHRLIERISDSGWKVQYRQLAQQVQCMEIAISPSSGVATASSLEAILCEWGIDISLLGAKVDNPRIKAGITGAAVTTPSFHDSRQPSNDLFSSGGSTGTNTTWDLDSQLFSFIVDEVVDPEEAYRDQVRDFLADLDRLPRLREAYPSSTASISHVTSL